MHFWAKWKSPTAKTSLAPAESVKLLQSLHARLDPDQTTNRVLMLRNSLLDRAGAFKADEAEEMDFFAIADLCETVKKQIDELKTLDASLKDHCATSSRVAVVEAHLTVIVDRGAVEHMEATTVLRATAIHEANGTVVIESKRVCVDSTTDLVGRAMVEKGLLIGCRTYYDGLF